VKRKRICRRNRIQNRKFIAFFLAKRTLKFTLKMNIKGDKKWMN